MSSVYEDSEPEIGVSLTILSSILSVSTAMSFTPSFGASSSAVSFFFFLSLPSSFAASSFSFLSFSALSWSSFSSSLMQNSSYAFLLRNMAMTSSSEPQDAWLRIPYLSVAKSMTLPSADHTGAMSK